MRSAIAALLAVLSIAVADLAVSPAAAADLVASPAVTTWSHERPATVGVIEDRDPTRPGLHDYTPPTPIGRGHGNAYFGAGYVEFLFSGSRRMPHLPPKTVYAGPLESWPYGNRRLRLRAGMSPRAGTYVALPEYTPFD